MGNHGVHTYTSAEVKEQNPVLYQYLIDQGYINQDGTLHEDHQ